MHNNNNNNNNAPLLLLWTRAEEHMLVPGHCLHRSQSQHVRQIEAAHSFASNQAKQKNETAAETLKNFTKMSSKIEKLYADR